jgi:hypothetical protein
MLVKTVHALDYRLVFAIVVWFAVTAWIADDIFTALHGLAVTFIQTAASPPLTGF